MGMVRQESKSQKKMETLGREDEVGMMKKKRWFVEYYDEHYESDAFAGYYYSEEEAKKVAEVLDGEHKEEEYEDE